MFIFPEVQIDNNNNDNKSVYISAFHQRIIKNMFFEETIKFGRDFRQYFTISNIY